MRGHTRKPSDRRQYFGDAEKELKPARSDAFICSAIAAGGKRNMHPCAKNASASNTWSTQSRIFTAVPPLNEPGRFVRTQ